VTDEITRRKVLLGLGTTAAALSAGCSYDDMSPTFGALFKAGDLATHYTHNAILRGEQLAREYTTADITPDFPMVGTKSPQDETYQRHKADGFKNWRLPVTGLVEQPTEFSLDTLRNFPSRTQITSHSCQEGWTAIGQWTGVPLAHVLGLVKLKSNARYVFFHAVDGWYDSLNLFDAFHAQTLLAYGMNGGTLPEGHGAPVRLRVERQLGYKSIKFVKHIEVVDSLSRVGDGLGSSGAKYGYSWNAGI